MNVTTLPSLLGIFALAFLLLLLIKVAIQPAEDQVSKRLLLLMLFGMFSMAFCLYFIYAGMYQHWPRLASIEIGFTYWIGPSLYFYIRRINGGPDPFARRINLLHWLPAILVEVLLLPFFLRSIPGDTDLLGYSLRFSLSEIRWVWWGFHLQLVVYLLLCQPYMRIYRQRLQDNFSEISRLNLRWLQLCCFGFIAMILAERLLPAVGVTSTSLSQIAGITLYLFIIVLMYFALGQSRLHFALAWQPAAKYSRSGLRDDSARYYIDKLNSLMVNERYYLESEISLQSLADRLKLSPHHLSQILNEKLGRNFYDYINEQRVAYARRLLQQEPLKSITDIACAAGYNSKNSFYNAFKRHSGLTPTEFRKQLQGS